MTSRDADRLYEWDYHSDQPHVIRDSRAKRRLYLLGAVGSLKTFLTGVVTLPVASILRLTSSATALPASVSAIGLGVNVESELAEKTLVSLDALVDEVEELGIGHILVRVPLGEPGALESSLELARRFANKQLLIDVLQDRDHVENPALLEHQLRSVFKAFSPLAGTFKIGNAVNRRKWAFNSLDEYFTFFRTAQRLRDCEFPQLELLGASIIDFELPNFARSLLHFYPIRYDAVAALLYVDRRGAPENTQIGANLLGKIAWFRSLMRLSWKCEGRLVITETNWPLVGTEPFAPAVGDCMVDEDQQAAYLARYYLLAFASGQVEAVYWHQLVAPGYGLIDNRGQSVRKRKAFYALKTLTALFSETTITGFNHRDGLYVLRADRGEQRVTAVWTNDTPTTVDVRKILDGLAAESLPENISVHGLTGEQQDFAWSITASGDATYFVQQRGADH